MSQAGTVEAILLDVGGTLVEQAPPASAVADLEPRLLPGVARTLAALSGRFRLGAVTDTAVMREGEVRALLDRAGIGHHLEVVVTSVDAGAAKPDPAGVLGALRRLGVPASRALLVGDSDADAAAASAAGAAWSRVAPGVALHEAVRAGLAPRLGAHRAAAALVAPLDGHAAAAADRRQAQLTKPPGSLGRLEGLGRQLAAIAGSCPPPLPTPGAVAVFGADHGVHAHGVSPWPQEVTAQMVANVATGGAAINVMARQMGARVLAIDVGVATPLPDLPPSAALLRRPVRRGTADLATGPAMAPEEAQTALDVGAEVAAALVGAGAACLITGDMGIANTTSSAAIVAALTGRSAREVTGRGTGIDDATWERKAALVEAAARRAAGRGPREALAEVGGLEHAALAGLILGGAAARVPVLADGVVACAALLVAAAIEPTVLDYVVAGHRSVEPGASAALDALGLAPLLDLDLRLGEGTGAVMALPVVEAAARVLREMATFDSAGVARGR